MRRVLAEVDRDRARGLDLNVVLLQEVEGFPLTGVFFCGSVTGAVILLMNVVKAALSAHRMGQQAMTSRRSAFLFTAGTTLLAVPLLTPCTFGLASKSVGVLDSAVHRGEANGADALPTRALRERAHLSHPAMRVRTHTPIAHGLLIAEVELRGSKDIASGNKAVSNAIFGAMGTAAAITDGVLAEEISAGAPMHVRGKLVLREEPYVELRAYEVRAVRQASGKDTVAVALASHSGKLTVVDDRGMWFALADEIHYRAAGQQALLQGSVIIKCGEQMIFPASGGLVLVHLDSGVVECSGDARITTSP